MENEIMTNEVVESKGIVKTVIEQGKKHQLAVVGAILVGGVAYKYIVKPAIAKLKAKKAQKTIIEAECEPVEDDENSTEN